MPTRVGINGFGRIGRNALRAAKARADADAAKGARTAAGGTGGSLVTGDIEWVAVNDLTDAATLGHLLNYDSILGRYPGTVHARDGAIEVDGHELKVLAESDPAALPWGELGVDVVIESTGRFTAREHAAVHLQRGARKVVISAPATDPDVTVVLGRQLRAGLRPRRAPRDLERLLHHQLPGARRQGRPRHRRHQARADDHDPRLHRRPAPAGHAPQGPAPRARRRDQPDPRLDRGREGDRPRDPRAAGQAPRVRRARPGPRRLGGRPHGRVRAPDHRRGGQRRAGQVAAESGPLHGIMAYTEDPIVSSDIVGSPYSSIVDSQLTAVMDGTMVKVVAWYDNEWGYSNRLVDLVQKVL